MRTGGLIVSVILASAVAGLVVPVASAVAFAADAQDLLVHEADEKDPVDPQREPHDNVASLAEYANEKTGTERAAPAPETPFKGIAPDLGAIPLEGMSLGILAAGAALAALGLIGATRFATRDEVLENPVRTRIYEHLRKSVGANLKQVTDELQLTTTNAIWHLRKLEDAGLIHSRRFNGYKVFYAAEGGIQARRLSLSVTALNNDNAQSVFEYVVANPGTHQREIARALEVNHGTVRWHLRKLRRAELLTELKRGKTSAYYATDIGLEALSNVARQARVPASSLGATLAGAVLPK